ncbi:ATP-binding cassette sub-family G member 5 [Frankliniella occidentalis]|uniref:ATP-binding cassette sub-family G member 5 n=1 Tax=Frankliniella occidentalis TaxID=133901 RepID=A0A9C6XS51_FRAOC|nr:ATP-binding cassette sub-family G member 5 [Frankliniella occidentalis]
MSKAGSHASLALSRRGLSAHSHLDDGAASKVTAMSDLGHPYYPGPGPGLGHGPGLPDLGHGAESTPFPYPHLQVRGLEVEARRSKRQLLLQGVSLEVRGGELMAIMATSAEEGTALLDTLAGCPSRLAGRVHGDILLNGQCMPRRSLSNRVAYVRSERTLNPYLSVEQTLYFTNWLRQPGYQGAKTDTKDRVAALVEDLGLEQVRHTKVWSLTTSEQRRLAVAAQLLLDTDVLVLDRPTAGMDIFDTFFLVEFLRQWAGNAAGSVTGRAVVMTMHPPTYEIFTMLSRVALLSKGRLMFCGRRRDMLPYFASAEYPCPSYKNPSDYYLDLVTLDDLSAEAMLESSQRIEQLADVFRRREEPLSDPGAPAGLPPSVRSANVLKQAAALLVCWTVYAQPGALSRWLAHLVLAVGLSLFLGVVWWDVAASDPQLLLGDRIGYLYAMLVVLPWPLLLQQAGWGDTWWRAVADDIRDRLYGRLVYILCQILYGLVPSAIIWAGYVVPAYTMTGLQNQATDPNAFYIYTGYSLLYLVALQSLLVALSATLRSRRAAGLVAGLVLLPLALLSGPLLHERDMEPWLQYAALGSPMRWVLPTLVRREYASDVVAASVANIMCRNKQVQHQDIIVQLPCPPPNVTAALQYHGLGPSLDAAALALLAGPVGPASPVGPAATKAALWPEPGALAWPAIALAVFWATFAVLACFVFPLTALRHRARRRPTSHRP